MSALGPGIRSLHELKKRLNRLASGGGLEIATKVAQAASDLLKSAAGEDYDSGRTVFGDARPLGFRGDQVSLFDEGSTRSSLAFIAAGPKLTASFGTPWSKYLVGRFVILPRGNERLPESWQITLNDVFLRVMREHGWSE